MKSYYQLTKEEKLNLTNDEFVDSVKLEAINRNIKPPIELSQALKSSEWTGYMRPAQAIPVYCPKVGYSRAAYGYLDQETAKRALDGLVLVDVGYGSTPAKIKTDEPTIEVVLIGVAPSLHKSTQFEDYFQDDEEYNKLRDECVKDLQTARQSDYDAKVKAEKRAEYLRLAGGDEEIAKAFWAKTERTEWAV